MSKFLWKKFPNNNDVLTYSSSEPYFDATPSEEQLPEDINFSNPVPDKKLRRTTPFGPNRVRDSYESVNINLHDSPICNRYDNDIQLSSSLKLSWKKDLPGDLVGWLCYYAPAFDESIKYYTVITHVFFPGDNSLEYKKVTKFEEPPNEIIGWGGYYSEDPNVAIEKYLEGDTSDKGFISVDRFTKVKYIGPPPPLNTFTNMSSEEIGWEIDSTVDAICMKKLTSFSNLREKLLSRYNLLQKEDLNLKLEKETISYKDLPPHVRGFIGDFFQHQFTKYSGLKDFVEDLKIVFDDLPEELPEDVGADFDTEGCYISFYLPKSALQDGMEGIVHEIVHAIQFFLKGKDSIIPEHPKTTKEYYEDDEVYREDEAEKYANKVTKEFVKLSWKKDPTRKLEVTKEKIEEVAKKFRLPFYVGDIVYLNEQNRLHNLYGPAIERASGSKYWYINGNLHRLDGPAIEYSDGEKWWYINGDFVGRSENGFTPEKFENYKREHNITRSLKLSWRKQFLKIGDEVFELEAGMIGKVVDITPDSIVVTYSSDFIKNTRSYYPIDEWFKFLSPLEHGDITPSASFEDYKQLNNSTWEERKHNEDNPFWESKEAQFSRFYAFTKGLDFNKDKTVLDVGCGFADFVDYCKEKNVKMQSYVGVDIVEEIVEKAKEKHPDLEIQLRDIQKEPFPENSFDFVIASGIFAFEHTDWDQYVIEMCKNMLNTCKIGVGINFIKEGIEVNGFHGDNENRIVNLLKENVTKKVNSLTGYLPDDFTIFLLK
jgi:SAM-dependent methyltransferase